MLKYCNIAEPSSRVTFCNFLFGWKNVVTEISGRASDELEVFLVGVLFICATRWGGSSSFISHGLFMGCHIAWRATPISPSQIKALAPLKTRTTERSSQLVYI